MMVLIQLLVHLMEVYVTYSVDHNYAVKGLFSYITIYTADVIFEGKNHVITKETYW